MTPNEMLALIRETVPDAYLGSTGGNCGAIIVDTLRGEILVTPDLGPWATPSDDDTEQGLLWLVSLHDEEGTWIDSDLVRDGDRLVMDDYVPHAVANLGRFAAWSYRAMIAEGV